MAATPHITERAYKWAHSLYRRNSKPLGVTWHHADCVKCGPDDVHRWHLANGWSGIAYHFFVAKNGTIYQGRPEWALGGHALGCSAKIGICCEGDYEHVDHEMPAKQLAAGRWLHGYLEKKYGAIPDRRHKDEPGNSTGCPGRWFPFAKLTK